MSSTEFILPTDETIVKSPEEPRKPLVDSFSGFVTYSFSFFMLILVWFVAGAGMYDMLGRFYGLYTFVYILWAVPIVGLMSCIFTGNSTMYWSGIIVSWTWFIIMVQAVRTFFYGFDLKTSPLAGIYPVASLMTLVGKPVATAVTAMTGVPTGPVIVSNPSARVVGAAPPLAPPPMLNKLRSLRKE